MSPAPVPAAPPSPTGASDGLSSSQGSSATIVVSRAALIAMGFFVGATVISQVTSLKIGVVLGRAVDMGTFIYPITFTLRDIVHKTAGRSAARTMIVTAALVNMFLALYLAFTVGVESDADWGLGQAYADVLGPIWRIVFASIVAMVISELLNTEVYHWWVTRVTRRFQWLRVLVSNGIALPVDNAIFAVLAFASLPLLRADALGWATVWDIFLVNLVVKFAVGAASVPLIYVVEDRNLPDPGDRDGPPPGGTTPGST